MTVKSAQSVITKFFGGVRMEFASPVYELLYFHQCNGTKFPPYWDLMSESDLIKIMPHTDGGEPIGCE